MIHSASAEEQRAENRQPVQTDPRGEPDRQRAQHDDRVFRVVNLRAIANEVGRADDAEGARQAGADDEHDERADDGQHDLGLHHGWLPHRRAAPPRPQASTVPRTAANGSRTTPRRVLPGGCRQCPAGRRARSRRRLRWRAPISWARRANAPGGRLPAQHQHQAHDPPHGSCAAGSWLDPGPGSSARPSWTFDFSLAMKRAPSVRG